jgi:hypothetical protein
MHFDAGAISGSASAFAAGIAVPPTRRRHPVITSTPPRRLDDRRPNDRRPNDRRPNDRRPNDRRPCLAALFRRVAYKHPSDDGTAP